MICHCGHDSSLHTELVDLGGGKKFVGCCSECGCIMLHTGAQNVLDCHECWKETPEGMAAQKSSEEMAKRSKERYTFVREALQKLAHDYNVRFPNDGKGVYKYYIFNSVHWE